MSPQLIIALVIAATSFLGGWTVNGWRANSKETARAQQQLVDQRNSANTAIRRLDVAADAEGAATVREQSLRADADSARAQLGSVRGTNSRTLRDAKTSLAACVERVGAYGELFQALGDAGADLAEKAGRHANDATKCVAEWPR